MVCGSGAGADVFERGSSGGSRLLGDFAGCVPKCLSNVLAGYWRAAGAVLSAGRFDDTCVLESGANVATALGFLLPLAFSANVCR